MADELEQEEAAVEEQTDEVVEEQPEEQPIQNPNAYLRIIKNQNAELLSDRAALQGRLAELENRQTEIQNSDEEEDDELGDNPLQQIFSEMKTIKKELARNKKLSEANEQSNNYNRLISAANDQIKERVNADPVYTKAITYLASIIIEEMDDRFPGKNQKERLAEAQKAVDSMKLKSLQRGFNVGDEMLKQAVRYGFDPDSVKPAAKKEAVKEKEEKAIPAKPKTAKEIIAREKNKGSSTVATLDGSTSSKHGLKTAVRNNPAEFNKYVDDQMKDGGLKRDNRFWRSPSFSDLLPDKVIRVQ